MIGEIYCLPPSDLTALFIRFFTVKKVSKKRSIKTNKERNRNGNIKVNLKY